MLKVWNICTCITRDYSVIHFLYNFFDMVESYIEDTLRIRLGCMWSAGDVLNMFTWFFPGNNFLKNNLKCYPPQKLRSWRLESGFKCSQLKKMNQGGHFLQNPGNTWILNFWLENLENVKYGQENSTKMNFSIFGNVCFPKMFSLACITYSRV